MFVCFVCFVVVVFCFFLFVFFVNITVFRVSVALLCIPIIPISIDTFLKVLELLSLEYIEEYRFALQQQQKSKKICHFMFSVEQIAYVTCMLDNNL